MAARRDRLKQRRALALAILGARFVTEVRLKNVERKHIARVLAATDNNLSLTADLLGMHRRSLQRSPLRPRKVRRG